MKIVAAFLGALVVAAVQAQEQDAEFVPGGATRTRPTFFSRPRPDRPSFGGDEPGLVFVRVPTASNNRPSLIDILTRAFRGDDSCCGGGTDIFPFFGTDRPGSNRPGVDRPVVIRPGADEDRPPQKLFPFPDFPIFNRPRPDTPSFGIFDDFFNSFGPSIPQGPSLNGFDFSIDDLPDTYENKTHTVDTIDGNRVEVNSTIKKDGDSFFHFHVVKLRPTDESSGTSPQVPEDVDTTIVTDGSTASPDKPVSPTFSTISDAVPEVAPEVTTDPYEDFGEKHGRVKRFSLPSIFTRYFGRQTTTEAPLYMANVNSPSNHIDIDLDNPKTYETENESPQSPVLISLSGDTRVNYVARNVESEALVDDVEIFDWDLVREEARRNRYNNNNQLQSSPLKAHPMAIYSVMSEPINSQTARQQPIKSQSIDDQSSGSESVSLIEPLGHHRHRYNPAIYQPTRLQSMSSEPMRSQPMRSQPMHSEPIRSQPMQSEPMRSQPMHSEPIHAQPMKTQPMRFQPMRSHQIESQPLRSQTSEQIPSAVYNSHATYPLRHERRRPNV